MKFVKKISLLAILLSAFFNFNVSAQTDLAERLAEANLSQGEKPKEESQIQVPQKFSSNDLITAATYAFSAQNGVALEDMSSGTTTVIAPDTDDNNSLLQNIGFDFWYDGVRFSTFGVNGNGIAKLGAAPTTTAFTNSLASTTEAPKIAAFWDDLCVGSGGKVHYKTIGSAPNRKLIVEWNNMKITRNGNCNFPNPNNGTFQLWLFESSHTTLPGVIQMVYGALPASAAADAGYSIGLQSGAATNFASVTTATDTVDYVTANNAQLTAIPAGKSYLFTPNVPAAPSGLTFGASTPTSNTLNWTDVAVNEFGYAIYRSLDNVTFTFAGQTAADATTFTDTGLAPATNYFYRVFAVSEGALSTPALTGSQSTLAGGGKSCVGVGGDWNNPAIWSPAGIPAATDNVTIIAGCTVTVNVTDAVALNVTIDAGGTLQSPTTGAVINNNLTVGGNVVNNGTLDFSTNGDTSAAILTFGAGGFDVALSGNGATTDIRDIAVAKGALATVVDVTVTNFTVRGVNTDVAGYLTLTSGTFKISSNFMMDNRTFLVAAYTIPAAGGFWLNNPNYTVTGQNGSPTNNGLLRLSLGTFNVGTASGNTMGAGTNAQFTINGGTMNIAGRLQSTATGLVYTQTGGSLNVSTVGNAAVTASFGLTSATNTFNWAGGTITLVVPSSSATPLDWSVSSASILITNPAGTTLNVGTGAAVETFRVTGNTPNILIPVNKTMNVGSGTGAAIFLRGSTVTNNGAIGTQGANSRFDWAASGPMSYGGTGTFGTAGAPFGGVGMSANSPTGNNTNITAPIILFRVNMFSGGFTGSGNITFGNGGLSTTVIQLGNSTTATNAGTFDVSPTYMLGSNGHILLYLRTTGATRNTGFEIPPGRSVVTFTYDNIVPGHMLTLTGGNLTITGVMTLTNGIFVTSPANQLTHNGTATRTGTCPITSCYIDGPMRREYTAIGIYTFHVGENGYSPVLINVTATSLADGAVLGFPSLVVEAFDATLAGMNPPTSISRNWAITEVGTLTADLSFTYLEADTPNTGVDTDETDYRVWRREGTGNTQTFTNMCPGGPCVNTATNLAGPVTGVTAFSRWTVADNQVPVAANVNVGGRVMRADGQGIPRTRVVLTDSNGVSRNAITSSFGYYNFEEVAGGQTVVVSVSHKQYLFDQPTRVINVSESVSNADFISSGVNDVINPNETYFDKAPFDFDGDGLTDQSVWRASNKAWLINRSSDNTWTKQAFGLPTDLFAPADFDGDGRTDLAVYRASEGNWYIWNSGTNDLRVVRSGMDGDIPCPVDVDGDGRADPVGWNRSTSTWTIRQSSNDETVERRFEMTDKSSVPLVGDYDTDGKADLTIFVKSSGTWRILLSSTGKTIEIRFGDRNGAAMMDDFDGDARADLAIYNHGIWTIRNSRTGEISIIENGSGTDSALVGDYDGDGRSDAAVYNAGRWTLRRSAGGFITIREFGTADDIAVPSVFVR